MSCSSTPKISGRLWRNRWRERRSGPPSTTPMTDHITWSHKIVCHFLLLLLWHSFAKCLDSERDGVSHEAVSKQISSRMAEDSQEWSYQGQDGCFASSRVYHYQPHSHKHKLLSTLQRASLYDLPPANNHVEIQQFPSAKNVQPTAIISRQPPRVISFVDEASNFSRRPNGWIRNRRFRWRRTQRSRWTPRQRKTYHDVW